MKYRNFSNLGWQISEIGLGCWAIGSEWGDVSNEDARNVLKTSLDNGINFFDTADVYGDPIRKIQRVAAGYPQHDR